MRCAPSRTCATEPGADAISGSNTVWIESTARTSGAISRTRSAIAGSEVSATTSSDGASALQPSGAEPDLFHRLLRAHEQAPRTGGGHAPHRLEQQCALADAGLAAEQRDRARHQPAAQHAVQLGDARGPPRRRDRVDLGEGHHHSGPGRGRAVGGDDRGAPPRASTTHRTRRTARATSVPGRRTPCSGRPGADEHLFETWRTSYPVGATTPADGEGPIAAVGRVPARAAARRRVRSRHDPHRLAPGRDRHVRRARTRSSARRSTAGTSPTGSGPPSSPRWPRTSPRTSSTRCATGTARSTPSSGRRARRSCPGRPSRSPRSADAMA